MKTTSTVRQTLAIFWQHTRVHKRYFWPGTFGAALGTIVQEIIPPFIIAQAFDRLQTMVNNGETMRIDVFLPYVLIYLALMVLGVIIWRTQVWFVWQYELRAVQDLAIRIFDHLQHLGTTFHSNRFGGALVSQTNKFLSAYEKVMDEFTWSITTGIVAFVTSFGILLVIYPVYALLFLAISIVFFAVAFYRTKITMPLERKLATSESQRTAKIADMITNISAVTTFASEQHEKQLFTKQAEDTSNHFRRLLRRVMVNDAMTHSMNNLISVVAFTSGILAIAVWHQPAGVLFLAVTYAMQINRRLWESTRVMRNLNRAFGDATDMTEILQMSPEIPDAANASKLRAGRGDIVFTNVDFAYADQKDKLLFKQLSLHIKPGEKVGLVGHSGGGKTTITKLLLRLMDIDGGTIAIDGQDIANATQTSVREAIAYVPQEPLLFHRSLAENIAYGHKHATQAELEAVAKMAHAHEFIQALPEGYHTLVGERGVKLSGGQRQRVAIARAMLKNAPILVLDEATSALDSESEVLIQDALWKLMDGKTAIVIAHRLSTIQKMDRIIVLDKGSIVEQGSHKELIGSNGVYAKLWAHQSGGFIEE